MDAIARVLATEEIRTLRIKYAHLLDSNTVDRLDEVFAADAVIDVGRGEWRGIAAVLAGLRDAFEVFDQQGHGTYPFHHAITNHWVEFTGPDRAEGRCYLIDLQTSTEVDRWILLGTYADEYVLEDGRWLISRSRLDVTWPDFAVGGGLPAAGLVLPS